MSVNPYLNAKLVESDRTADLVGRARLWQALALMAMMLALVGVAGMVIFASRSQFIPYVVEVDRLGQSVGRGRADQAARVDERVIRHTLALFIRDCRSISFDPHIHNEAIWRVYSSLKNADPATTKMTTYMTDELTSPPKRAQKVSVGVEVVSVLSQNADTWEVIWLETTWDRATGAELDKTRWRALLNVYVQPPTSATTEEEIFRNPLGIFIKDFSWSAILK